MDRIIQAIDDALNRKGLSDAAASRLAVGHPSLIKNFRAVRPGAKRYNVSSLEKLAEVLDIEFYFGPPRGVDGASPGESAPPAAYRGAPGAASPTQPIPDPRACDAAAPREIAYALNLPDGATIPEAVAEIERLVKLPSEMTSLLAKAR